MKDVLRVLQWQMKTGGADAQTLAEEGCAEAKRLDADLLALPEMFCCPYETAQFPLRAEPEGGETYRRCAALARKYGLWLSAGSAPERGADGRIYNTAYVFDRAGNCVAKHRKMHLFDVDIEGGQRFRESDTLSAGNTVTTFDFASSAKRALPRKPVPPVNKIFFTGPIANSIT